MNADDDDDERAETRRETSCDGEEDDAAAVRVPRNERGVGAAVTVARDGLRSCAKDTETVVNALAMCVLSSKTPWEVTTNNPDVANNFTLYHSLW